MNMGTHISLLDFTFRSFEYLPGSRAGSYGNHKSLKDCHSVYHSGYTMVLYSGYTVAIPTVHNGSDFSTSLPTLVIF